MRLEFIACKYTVFIRHLKVLKKLFFAPAAFLFSNRRQLLHHK
mgnify:FL=1